jgi:asparagine synthase (glutamine-hydrolysing)
MGQLLVHRGPDDAGTLYLDTATGRYARSNRTDAAEFSADLALTFRRLKIIDLSERGAQPMSNADGSLWIVFNGEVYNYIELRAEFEAAGRRFRSQSDTEVLLAVYEAYGPAGFQRLNGMFAAAIWDQQNRRLVLLRDRLGIKPLYYSWAGQDLVFGSEIKALLCHPKTRRALDPFALSEYLTFHFPLENRTLFKDVYMLEPGTYAICEDGRLQTFLYWRMTFGSSPYGSVDEAAEALRPVLKAVLNRQIRSDVPIGTYLSGGMDTGAISALVAPALRPFHTFTCGFNTQGMDGLETYFDERADAAALAQQLGTIHHEEEVVSSDLMTLTPEVMWHLEDPRVGISHQIYKLARLVRQNVTVVLSGTGGDELFAGYPWRYTPIIGVTDPKVFAKRFYDVWARICTDELRGQLLSSRVQQGLDGWTPRQSFEQEIETYIGDGPLHAALAFEARNFLQGVLLVDDKLTMAHSIEGRVPLLDNEVVDFVTALPSEMKFDGTQTKIVLRKALRGILPDKVINRRKQGFTPPEATWMRTSSRAWIESVLLSNRSLERGLFERHTVERIIADHMSGEANHRFLLWSLLCIEWAHRLFFEGDDHRATVMHTARAQMAAHV